ncbi:hypothetical protein SHDE107825_02720 [Shewanella denitrificans]
MDRKSLILVALVLTSGLPCSAQADVYQCADGQLPAL